MLFFALVGKEAFKRRVLVLGAGHRARQLLEDLTTPFNRKGFTLDGFVALPDEPIEIPDEHLINMPMSLHDYVLRHPVREIVVAVDDRRRGLPMEDLLECKMEGVHIIDGANFYERESRKVALEMITRGWLVFSDGFSVSSVYGVGKRTLDILTAGTLLLATFPIMILTAIAIKIEDGLKAPVFYSQERVGLNNRVFRVHKFRSMITDAEKNGAVWATQNDARVTRVGDFIRKVRIDELPQIFNVLNGSMAFVGPRPERPVFVEQLSERIPFYSERHRVKPGLTGWAQLCFAYADNEEDTREKLRYDLYYIKNQSLLLDLLVIIQTVEVVLFKKDQGSFGIKLFPEHGTQHGPQERGITMSRKYLTHGLLVSFMAVALVTGCAGPSASSPDKIQRALAVDTRDSVDQYILGPTDVVTVSVWRNDDLSISVPIRPDGKISVPLVGDVQASGRAPEELASSIRTSLTEYIREPQVSVVVTSMGSHEFTDRVRVTGAVRQAISIPHRSGMTVLDILLSAGGGNEFAALNNAMLYRKLDGEIVAIPVRLGDILNKGQVETNYSMRPGDILTIPERSF